MAIPNPTDAKAASPVLTVRVNREMAMAAKKRQIDCFSGICDPCLCGDPYALTTESHASDTCASVWQLLPFQRNQQKQPECPPDN